MTMVGALVPGVPHDPSHISLLSQPRRIPHPSRRPRRSAENSDVLVSAVISTYLLTHLHHVLQRAEYGASQEGRSTQAANYAQLRWCSAWTPAAWRTPRPRSAR